MAVVSLPMVARASQPCPILFLQGAADPRARLEDTEGQLSGERL